MLSVILIGLVAIAALADFYYRIKGVIMRMRGLYEKSSNAYTISTGLAALAIILLLFLRYGPH